jgi:hypothetical protein
MLCKQSVRLAATGCSVLRVLISIPCERQAISTVSVIASPTGRYVCDNALLRASFAELYSDLCAVLTAALGPVRFHPQLALPGFHLFAPRPGHDLLPGTQAFASAGGSVHVDLQHRAHGSVWQGFERIDWARPLSFTLALALPACGGGLRIWPRTTGVTEAEAEQAELVSYRLGELVSFTQPLLHQIAPAALLQAGDQRITLQGHGLCCDGTWLLYF